jgi:uncharacterized coiled-coil protein SlyX
MDAWLADYGFWLALAAGLVWLVRLEARALNNERRIDGLDRQINAQWKRLDEDGKTLTSVDRRSEVLSKMMSPDKVRDHYVEETRFRTSVEHRLADAERQLARLSHPKE